MSSFTDRAVLLSSPHGSVLLVPTSLKRSGKLLIGIAEALGEAIGSRRAVGVPLIALSAQLGDNALDSSVDDFARVLGVPVIDIRGVLGAARTSIAVLIGTIRPFLQLLIGESAAKHFFMDGEYSTLEDVVNAVSALGIALPEDPATFVRRCRDVGSVEAIAKVLRVDLAALNVVLNQLGEPYLPIDLTSDHQATLAAFLSRKEPRLIEGIREAYRPQFEAGGNLTAYVAVRDAPRLSLPAGVGRALIELPQPLMEQWLGTWMNDHHVWLAEGAAVPHSTREAIFAVIHLWEWSR